jgi:hypothetical protein
VNSGRDEFHRVTRLPDLLGLLAAGLVVGVLAMLALDGLFALLGAGDFGQLNGWLALILPGWLFIEEFRAWRSAGAKPLGVTVAALLAVMIGLTGGMTAANGVADLLDAPALASGAAGAAVCSLCYAVAWFHSVRRLTGP